MICAGEGERADIPSCVSIQPSHTTLRDAEKFSSARRDRPSRGRLPRGTGQRRPGRARHSHPLDVQRLKRGEP